MANKKGWRGYSSYGKTALGIDFDVEGVDELLENIKRAGKNVTSACEKAINECLPMIEEDMKAGAERHRKSGDVVNAIESVPAKVSGNYIYGKVGIDISKHPEAKHAVFQEYGDGHSMKFPDPFVRPTIDDNRRKIRKLEKDILKKEGIPTG